MISKIYELILLFTKTIVNFFFNKSIKVEVPIIKNEVSQVDKYVSRNTEQFLKSYENDNVNWNENCVDDCGTILWEKRMLLEQTPRGNILLKYNVKKEAFDYYMDSSCVPYTILNAIAMKFVLIFRCRDYYVDEDSIPIGNTSSHVTAMKLKVQKENEKLEENQILKFDSNSPFARLKSRTEKKVRFNFTDATKIRNKFVYKGKLSNFTLHQKEENKRKEINRVGDETTYKTYKIKKRLWQDTLSEDLIIPVTHSSEFDFPYNLGGCEIES